MFQKIFFTFVMSFLCFGVVAQEYEKKRGTIRLLTYNTHYCNCLLYTSDAADEL